MEIANYDPLAPVTIQNFQLLLNQWDGVDPHVTNILTGMITVLNMQGLEDQVNSLLKKYHHEQI